MTETSIQRESVLGILREDNRAVGKLDPPEVIPGFCDAPESSSLVLEDPKQSIARVLATVGSFRSSGICDSRSHIRRRCSSASSP
jgi:hypothetical protein